MAVNQNISKFINVAASKDFARNNLYRVMGFATRALTLTEDDLVYCKGADIPGRNTPTATVSYNGMKMNYNQSTVEYNGADSYTLEFYLDKDGDLRKRFEEASRKVFNEKNNTGDWRFPSTQDRITVAQLGFDLEPIKTFTLVGVAIKAIDIINTSIAEGDGSAQTAKITISYIYYETEGADVGA
ncbi:MAG: hypothetical protein J6R59_03060 [Paludibacteraceae bacterium]|nr:hypothetical protein [Paludibacteraceae bacterium]